MTLNMDAETAMPALHTMPDGKAVASPAKVTTEDNVELSDMDQSGVKLPLLEDIMQLSRIGEIGPIQKLLDDGKFSANYHEEEGDQKGITPLHV